MFTAREYAWLLLLLQQAGFDVSDVTEPQAIAGLGSDLLVVDAATLAQLPQIQKPERPAVLAVIEHDLDAQQALTAQADEYITPSTSPDAVVNRAQNLARARVAERQLHLQNEILAKMSDAVIIVDNENRVQYWNEGAEHLYGIPAPEILGKRRAESHDYEWIPPDDASQCYEALAKEGWWKGENVYITRDQRRLNLEISVQVLKNGDGTQQGLLGVIHDITKRRQVEAAEHEQRLLAEALRDTASALTRTLDPQSVMNLILENVGRVVPHQTANIMTIDSGSARVAFSRGYPPEVKTLLDSLNLPLDMPTLHYMLVTGESILIEDTEQDSRWQSIEQMSWIRSHVATPIRAYDHVIGFLNLDADQPHAFSSGDAERLRAFADQTAIAIENAQLYDAIYRDASEMRALHRATGILFTVDLFTSENVQNVAEQIAQTVVNEFGKVDCGVIMLDETRTRLVRLARAGDFGMHTDKELQIDGAGLVPEAVRTGTIVYAPDVNQHPLYIANDSRTRSELVVPFRTMKGVIGVLDLQSAEVAAFDTHDRRVMQVFAERAAVALENMKLYNEIQQRVNERTSELNRVKDRAEAILNHSSDAILLLREDGRIQQTNNAFNGMFGFGPDEAFGKTFEAIAGPYYAELLHQSLQDVLEHKHAVRIEIVATRSDNSSVDADVVMSPVFTQEQVSSVVCSLRDISQRKRMEFELRDALEKERELNDLKSRFIARASHEFRTPLAMISTASDLLKNYGDRMTEEQRVEKLNRLQSEIKNLTALLDDLLTISKAEEVGRIEFQPVPFDVGGMCADLVGEMRDGIGMNHDFEFLASGDCRHVHVDRKLLRRAVLNLLSNAVKYSAVGSKIQLSLTCEPAQTIIVVQDSGIGIPEDDQKQMFEAFHRGRNVEHIAGTGLGLAIVKQSVELHGGEVSFRSQVGIGSAFILTIPNLALKEEFA
jgi:PAS domain S-box-containing protein